MRKLLCILGLLILLPVCHVFAAEPDVTLTGPDRIHARDYFSVPIEANTADITALTFTLSYDTENLVFLGFDIDEEQWKCDMDRNRFSFTATAAQDTVELPILLFRLRNVAVGTTFWVTLTDAVICMGEAEKQVGTLRWEQTSVRPVSSENHLSSLKISDAVLSPEFSPYTQFYTAKVSYHIASIDVTATAMDPYAQVEINSPELKPNAVTDVTVTVTAEDGVERVYTIAVTREEDPNRPLSSECDLSEIVADGFMISPEFKPGTTEYVLWLPYEVSSVDIHAVPKDHRAAVTVEGNTRFKAGKDNPIVVTCTAEDGTKKVYTIIAKRAEEYVPATTAAAIETMITEISVPIASTPTNPKDQQGSDMQIPSWSYIVIAVGAITGCAAVGILISERKK